MFVKKSFKLTFITPAFIGGADKNKAEFRVPSFIGILRYWFRTLALTATDDLNAVYELETKLFGNTDRAGLVRVWVEEKNIKVENFLPNVDQNLGYLGYGNFRGTRVNKEFIAPQSKVKLAFLYPQKYEKLLKSFLFLVSHFGALGSRNRRGWGAFYLEPGEEDKENWQKFDTGKFKLSFNEFKEALSQFIKIQAGQNTLLKLSIYLLEFNSNNESGLEVLREFGRVYKHFRQKKHFSLYPNEKANLHEGFAQRALNTCKGSINNQGGKRVVLYSKIWFGLPIMINKISRRYNNEIERKFNEIKNIVDNEYKQANLKRIFSLNLASISRKIEESRLASPLIIRPVKIANDKCALLIIIKKFEDETVYRNNTWNKSNNEVAYALFRLNVKTRNKTEPLCSYVEPVQASESFDEYMEKFLDSLRIQQNYQGFELKKVTEVPNE